VGQITSAAPTITWKIPDADANPGEQSGIVAARYSVYSLTRSYENTVYGNGISAAKLELTSGGDYTVSVQLIDGAGNYGDEATIHFTYDPYVPERPTLSPIPRIDTSTPPGAVEFSWDEDFKWPSWSAGACFHFLLFNNKQHDDSFGDGELVTLPADATSYTLSAEQVAALSDGPHYVHVRVVTCDGIAGHVADGTLAIDRTPPIVKSNPAGDGWLPPGSDVRLTASDPPNQYAGVASLSYAVDDGAWTTAPVASVTIPAGQGKHDFHFYATDLFGNSSAEKTISAGVDAIAPTAAFDAPVESDPTLLRARVSDGDSGVSEARIEYSPPGSDSWARLVGDIDGDSEKTVSARMPDDSSLPPGMYRLRVVARDNAGNTSITTNWVGGGEASVALPLRPRPTLTLALAAAPGKPTVSSLTVPFGSAVEARGFLRRPNGNPVAAATVAIAESVNGGPPARIALVTTAADGSYSARIPAGASRAITAQFLGDLMLAPMTETATFSVRGMVRLNKPRANVRRGQVFYLRGKVDPGPVALPRLGATVAIQHRSGKHWSGLTADTRTASDGSFVVPWNVKSKRRGLRMTFRAVVTIGTGWPYADGYSVMRTVVVR
jgi:hypothetical protein